MNTSRICTDLLQKLPRRKSIHLDPSSPGQNMRPSTQLVRSVSRDQKRSLRQTMTIARIERLNIENASKQSSLHSLSEEQEQQRHIPPCFESIVEALLRDLHTRPHARLSKTLHRRTGRGESLVFQVLRLSDFRATSTTFTARAKSDTILWVLQGAVTTARSGVSADSGAMELKCGSSSRIAALQKIDIQKPGTGGSESLVLMITDALNQYTCL